MKGTEQPGQTEDLPNSKFSRTTPEAQASSRWTAPAGTLGRLVEDARRRARDLGSLPPRDEILSARRNVPSLRDALGGETVSIIAEIKRSSPSKGVIEASIDSGARAAQYEAGGAAAISVLTEPERFSGRDDDIASVRASSRLPILKKDFHVTEVQIAHAAYLGAAAALVIVRAIAPSELAGLAAAADDFGLELLYEVRDGAELERALSAGALMIGINNRNLETLEIDPGTVARILPLVPASCIAVAESGYSSRVEIERAADAGADAVLVGSSLSASPDPVAAVRALAGVGRHSRAS